MNRPTARLPFKQRRFLPIYGKCKAAMISYCVKPGDFGETYEPAQNSSLVGEETVRGELVEPRTLYYLIFGISS
jgi:hypothetical protein